MATPPEPPRRRIGWRGIELEPFWHNRALLAGVLLFGCALLVGVVALLFGLLSWIAGG